MKKELKVPKFKSEREESQFWAKLDLSKYFESKDFKVAVFPDLKPSTRSISIRLPEYLLSLIKERANQSDIPYQSLIKATLTKHFTQ